MSSWVVEYLHPKEGWLYERNGFVSESAAREWMRENLSVYRRRVREYEKRV